jgi:hypothetical protein
LVGKIRNLSVHSMVEFFLVGSAELLLWIYLNKLYIKTTYMCYMLSTFIKISNDGSVYSSLPQGIT